MSNPDDKWQKLVAAARQGRHETPAPQPPKEFAQRVIGLKQTIIDLSKLLFWRRWSLWVALACVLAFVILFVILRATAPKAPLIEPPLTPATPR